MTQMHGYNKKRGTLERIFSDGHAAKVSGSLISYHWAGAGTTNAPDATDFYNYTIGVNSDGASTGNVYHVIDGTWTDTGATVANLYGG